MSFSANSLKLLHLDLTKGCLSDHILASLAALGAPLVLVHERLKDLGFSLVKVDLQRGVGFYKDAYALIFNEIKADQQRDLSCFIQTVRDSKLPPCEKVLVEQLLMIMAESHTEQKECLHFSEVIYVRVIVAATLFSWLNPAQVSASTVTLNYTVHDLATQSALLALAAGIPTQESEEATCDMVGLALVKHFASSFGSRPHSIIIKNCLGMGAEFSAGTPSFCRALLCEPSPIATHERERADAQLIFQPLYVLSAELKPGIALQGLIGSLRDKGAQSICCISTTQNAFEHRIQLSCLAESSLVENIIELLLVQGEAAEVIRTSAEQYCLHKRTVVVPLGSGQSLEGCRVIEYQFADKIVRAEPHPEDLNLLVARKGFAHDSIRQEILSAWKRWRRQS